MKSVSTSSRRHGRKALGKLEQRLAALEKAIARHEERAAELKEIRDQVQAERAKLLATEEPPVPVEEKSVEEKSVEEKPVEEVQPVRSGRPAGKGGLPPEAAAVRASEEGAANNGDVSGRRGVDPVELWAKFWDTRRKVKRPPVIYPWSPENRLQAPPEEA